MSANLVCLGSNSESAERWLIVGASVTGLSHLSANQPCEDSLQVSMITKEFGVAVVCDGAGSAGASEKGSRFITTAAVQIFTEIVQQRDWPTLGMPGDQEWATAGYEGLQKVREQLTRYAAAENLALEEFASTVIIVVFSPTGLLLTHIGDGRAAYCGHNEEWHSMMTPHKGEEMNATFFITSAQWNETALLPNGPTLPESRVIHDAIRGFALLTDGCERHCFEVSKMNETSRRWTDPNLPFAGFFNPIARQLEQMVQEESTHVDIQQHWTNFLLTGTQGLRDESDDKTMVFAILLP